jgi:hypothetical protein
VQDYAFGVGKEVFAGHGDGLYALSRAYLQYSSDDITPVDLSARSQYQRPGYDDA